MQGLDTIPTAFTLSELKIWNIVLEELRVPQLMKKSSFHGQRNTISVRGWATESSGIFREMKLTGGMSVDMGLCNKT
jgi:hypothetical protein